ncbi:sterol O-acyltransferase 2 isoform X3 [Octodon degus]|uniref:Sterol O-acyltransferase 2 isoform X3 n=1 Tax=Octodon degus TaxID=10160 RepID=A0A6P6F2G4_OCTDE|nr:sterol O-acyltransferase 2 isoform X3 [Octodon degus]
MKERREQAAHCPPRPTMESCGAHLRTQRRGVPEQEQEQEQHSTERNTEPHRAPDLVQWTRHMEAVKRQLLEQAQGQLGELLDWAMREAIESYPTQDRPFTPSNSKSKTQEPHLGKQKVFIIRKSLLDELMEVQHFRTIYHMFVAGLCVFIISTLAIDFIDEDRLVLELDLLIFSFGQLPLALVTWVPMFLSTLLVPYQALRLCSRPQTGGLWTLGVALGCVLLAAHASVLCILPVHVVLKHELPPASRCVLVFEQVRLLMKSYSFLRETVPGTLRVKGGEGVWAPSFSSYLYFLFCPTLIYRETYPRQDPPQIPRPARNLVLLLSLLGPGYLLWMHPTIKMGRKPGMVVHPCNPSTREAEDFQHQVELCGQELRPGLVLCALCLLHPGSPLCPSLCQHESGALQHPCAGALNSACHTTRTGGTQHLSPTTTVHGTWLSMTGCTATCIRMGCGSLVAGPEGQP